ncbi:hypothetical protein COO60DRAFT_762597, partial [Scenedesmus sp. NREL 46B-D3]
MPCTMHAMEEAPAWKLWLHWQAHWQALVWQAHWQALVWWCGRASLHLCVVKCVRVGTVAELSCVQLCASAVGCQLVLDRWRGWCMVQSSLSLACPGAKGCCCGALVPASLVQCCCRCSFLWPYGSVWGSLLRRPSPDPAVPLILQCYYSGDAWLRYLGWMAEHMLPPLFCSSVSPMPLVHNCWHFLVVHV